MINLALSENNNSIPTFLSEELKDELLLCNKYPDEMFQDIEEMILEKNGLDQNYHVLIGNGVDEIILLLFMALKQNKGKIICSCSTFNGYKYSAKALEIEWDEVPMNAFMVDSKEMRRRIDSNTSAVVICNPHNPCGTIMPLQEISGIINKAKENGALVIIDEAYIEFVENDEYRNGIRKLFLLSKNVIELHTLSKAYGLAGLRCGYALIHGGVLENVFDITRALPFRVNRLACAAVQVCLEREPYYKKQIEEIRKLKQELCNVLDKKNIAYVESETNFILVDLGERSSEIRRILLDKYQIKVRACEEFGYNGFVRISIGTEAEMNVLIKAIDEICREFKYA